MLLVLLVVVVVGVVGGGGVVVVVVCEGGGDGVDDRHACLVPRGCSLRFEGNLRGTQGGGARWLHVLRLCGIASVVFRIMTLL